MKKLFLDDVRVPFDCAKYMRPDDLKYMYEDEEWDIVRTYNDFVGYIEHFGVPDLISFDHDLADEHYDPSMYSGNYDDVAKNFKEILTKSMFLIAYAIFAPIVHAIFALLLGKLFGVSLGDTILLMLLAASASYIAVPAALKYALPTASPSLYFGMSLGLTFPINILIGIPSYTYLAKLFF